MKEELVEFEGTVTELLRGGMFRVEIDESKHEIMAQVNGKMRMYKIKVLFQKIMTPMCVATAVVSLLFNVLAP